MWIKNFPLLAIVFITGITLIGQNEDLLNNKFHGTISDVKLIDILGSITQQVGFPILYEGYPQKGIMIKKITKSGNCKEVLNSLFGTDHKWFVKDGVIVIQDKKFVEDPNYPINKYRFSCLIDADTQEKFKQQREQFFLDLRKQRIMLMGLHISSNKFVAIKKEYKDANLRDIVIDLLQNSKSVCVIYKIVPEETAAIYKIMKEHNMYNDIQDAEKPLYGFFADIPPQGANKLEDLPQKKNELSKEKEVLIGSALLKVKLILLDENGLVFKFQLKNISSQVLVFESLKTENLIIHGMESKDKNFGLWDSSSFLIYPPESCNVPENIELKSGEETEIKFPILQARYKKYLGPTVWDIGVEKSNNVNIGNSQLISRQTAKYCKFGPLVYFYTKNGDKYKAYQGDEIIREE